jgi:uncharacterized membrane protein YhaH (DUF805 family)
MKFRLSDLWSWDGETTRGPYVAVGVIGFGIKHNLDRFLAYAFHRGWDIFNYWIPPEKFLRPGALSPEDYAFVAVLVATALPFIWVGTALTARRLRSIGLPVWLTVLFFAPVLNLLFFLLLSVLPARPGGASLLLFDRPSNRLLDRLIPQHGLGSAVAALLLVTPVGVLATLLSAEKLGLYGWGLFIAVPFCLGFAAVLIYGYHAPRSYLSCLAVSVVAPTILGMALLALAMEGIICLIMAGAIGLPLSVLGGTMGYLLQRRPIIMRSAPATLASLILFIPGVMGLEHAMPELAPTLVVRTAIDIDAPPERVWNGVVAFAEIPEPKEWIFRLGIAYPIRATIRGEGVGAVRHCEFSTGPFVEPIEVWDEPRLLKFSVTANPAPMQEWTPYKSIHPPHLEGFMESRGGQFLLTPLPGGRTRLEGTTWYQHHMWPAPYWQVWSDAIIHRIHLRVLNHIKGSAERKPAVTALPPAQ